MDKLILHQVECFCRIGVPAAERKRRQKIWMDLAFELDLRPAVAMDQPGFALDYCVLEGEVRALAEKKPCRLMETLAETVAMDILKRRPAVKAVCVRVTKKPKVMPKTGSVCVEIRRCREGYPDL